VGTSCALLHNAKITIGEDSVIGAGLNAGQTTIAELRIDEEQPIFPPLKGVLPTDFLARGVITMLAQTRHVRDHNFRYLASYFFLYLEPEVPDIRLRPGIGRPIIVTMLILTADLATKTTVAAVWVKNEYFLHD